MNITEKQQEYCDSVYEAWERFQQLRGIAGNLDLEVRMHGDSGAVVSPNYINIFTKAKVVMRGGGE